MKQSWSSAIRKIYILVCLCFLEGITGMNLKLYIMIQISFNHRKFKKDLFFFGLSVKSYCIAQELNLLVRIKKKA